MKILIVIGLSLMLISGFAQQEITLKLDKFDASNMKVGDNIQVPLKIEAGKALITSFQLYVEYDSAVLKCESTSDVFEGIKSELSFNITDKIFAAVYINMDGKGQSFDDQNIICNLNFTYLGGESGLNWGQKQIVKDNRLVRGETIFAGKDRKQLELNLINGCVCNTD